MWLDTLSIKPGNVFDLKKVRHVNKNEESVIVIQEPIFTGDQNELVLDWCHSNSGTSEEPEPHQTTEWTSEEPEPGRSASRDSGTGVTTVLTVRRRTKANP